jgi:trehalose 6-phosphate phosphatase
MRHILAARNRALLRTYARSNVLLAFDYDGTLAPIVADPDQAHMRERTCRLLDDAAARYPCVVISGRARADVAARLRGAGVRDVIGNHGLEPFADAQRLSAEVRRFMPVLEQCLAGLPGVRIEDKRFSIAVHYRRARQKARARAAVTAAAEQLGNVRLIGGKELVNLLPQGAPDKGFALEEQRVRFGCERAIYVGDDETDEDAFARGEAGRVLPVRVGARRASCAHFYVRDQSEIDVLLEELVALRSDPAQSGSGSLTSRSPWQ